MNNDTEEIFDRLNTRIHRKLADNIEAWQGRLIWHIQNRIHPWKGRFTPQPDKPGVVREFYNIPKQIGRMPVKTGDLLKSVEAVFTSQENLTFGAKSDLDYAWYIEHGTAGRMVEKRVGNRIIHKMTKGVPRFAPFEYGKQETIKEITPEIDLIVDGVVDEFMEDISVWVDKLIE